MGRFVTSSGYRGLDVVLNANAPCFVPTQSRIQCATMHSKVIQKPVKTVVVSDNQSDVSTDVEMSSEEQEVMVPVEEWVVQDDPEEEISVAGDQFIHGLGLTLARWVEAASAKPEEATIYHSARAPKICIGEYLNRIRKYNAASDECYVLALVYIDRASKNDPSMAVSKLNVHRLLVTAAMLAAKFNDDMYYSNSYYAKVGGVQLREMNMLEAKFIKALNWKLFVSPKEYQQYHDLVCTAAGH